uniref:Uncharacterized protein n=1 Tax=Helianthus annuus TaxID=4232 RepID=A0A251ST45_HELAN
MCAIERERERERESYVRTKEEVDLGCSSLRVKVASRLQSWSIFTVTFIGVEDLCSGGLPKEGLRIEDMRVREFFSFSGDIVYVDTPRLLYQISFMFWDFIYVM